MLVSNNVLAVECMAGNTFDIDLELNRVSSFDDSGTGVLIVNGNSGPDLYDIDKSHKPQKEYLERIGVVSGGDIKMYVSKRSSLVDVIFSNKNNPRELIRISILPDRNVVYLQNLECEDQVKGEGEE